MPKKTQTEIAATASKKPIGAPNYLAPSYPSKSGARNDEIREDSENKKYETAKRVANLLILPAPERMRAPVAKPLKIRNYIAIPEKESEAQEKQTAQMEVNFEGNELFEGMAQQRMNQLLKEEKEKRGKEKMKETEVKEGKMEDMKETENEKEKSEKEKGNSGKEKRSFFSKQRESQWGSHLGLLEAQYEREAQQEEEDEGGDMELDDGDSDLSMEENP